MKIITTTNVSDPNVQQPFLAPSLDFLQGGVREILNALAQGLYGNNAANYIAIYGCVQTDLGGGNFQYSAGYIYNVAAGQIFFVPAIASIAQSNPYVHLVTTQAAFDPVTFSNGATFSVHYNYTYAMNNSATGSIFRYAQISFVQKTIPAFVQGQSSETATNSGQVLKFPTNVIDPNSWYDATTGKFTPSIAGYYEVSSGIVLSIAASLSGFLIELDVNKNGTYLATLAVIPYSGNSTPGNPNGSFIVLMNGTTDYLTVSVGLTSSQNWTNTSAASKVSYKLIQPQF